MRPPYIRSRMTLIESVIGGIRQDGNSPNFNMKPHWAVLNASATNTDAKNLSTD